MDLSDDHYELLLPGGKQPNNVPSTENVSILPQATATNYSPTIPNHQPTMNSNLMSPPAKRHFSFHPVPEIGEAIPIDLNRAISSEITWLDPTIYPQESIFPNDLPIRYASADNESLSASTPSWTTNGNSTEYQLPTCFKSLKQEEIHSNPQVIPAPATSAVLPTKCLAKVKIEPTPKKVSTNRKQQQKKSKKPKATPRKKTKTSKRKYKPSVKAKKATSSTSSAATKKVPKEQKLPSTKYIAYDSSQNVSKSDTVDKKTLTKDETWYAMLEEYIEFKTEHGPIENPSACGAQKKLSNWVKRQRCMYKKAGLSKERVDVLTNIGFCWDPKQAKWDAGFIELQDFVLANGHADVPTTNSLLHSFTKRIKTQYQLFLQGKNHTLTEESIAKLACLGFPL